MASRKLARMKIDPVMLSRLTTKQILTPADLFQKNQYELISLLDATEDEVTAVFDAVSAAIIPPPKTALQLLSEAKGPQLTLDTKGQIPALRIGSGITEFVGAAGVGKSQICMQLSSVLAASGGGVLFFDTEQTFAPNRLLQIARARFPAECSSSAALKQLALKVTVFKDSTSDKLYSRLQSIEETIIEQNIKLIVVDSIAALVRVEFDRDHLPQRQERLGAIASQLKYLGEQFRIPIVVTNQITTKAVNAGGTTVPPTATDSKTTAFRLDAALGVGWAHAVNTRFWIEDLKTHKEISLWKSPLHASITLPFLINDGGLDFESSANATTATAAATGTSGSGGSASKPVRPV